MSLYDIRVWMWPGASPATDMALWGAETDISAKVRYPGSDGGAPITYTAGRQDEGAQVDPGALTLTLDNRTGDFSTENAQGAYFGKLSRNTPLAYGMLTATDAFARSAATWGANYTGSGTGVTFSTDGARGVAAFAAANQSSRQVFTDSGAADYDITWTTTAGPTTTGAAVVSSAIQYAPDGSYLLFKLGFEISNALTVTFQRVGTTAGSLNFGGVTLPYAWSAATRYTCRARRVGSQVYLKVWRTDSESQPATWTTSGSESYVPAGDLGVHVWRVAGNTNAGTYTLYIDDLTIIGLEFVGTVVQWPLRWDKSGNNSWAPIQATGILRRLQQGKGPLKSPLTRQLGAYGPVGWWTFEDDSSAGILASQLSGGRPATFGFVQPAGDSSLDGSSSAVTLEATNGFITSTGLPALPPGSTGFAGMLFTKFGSGLPAVKTNVATWTCASDGLITRWTFSVDLTTWYIDAYAADNSIQAASSGIYAVDTSQWVAWQLETEVVSGSTNYAFISHQVGSTTYNALSGPVATSYPNVPTGFKIGGTNLPVGTAFAHMWIGPNTLPFVTNSFSLVSAGYAGELAADRITRLCREEGIPATVEPGTSRAVGVQPQANIITALRNAADADMGILFESGTGVGYRPSGARYNQPVWTSLSVAAGQIDDPPEPINDDQRYRNSYTLSREGGSSAVVIDSALIARDGLYEDSATANLATDSVLIDNASWRLSVAKRSGFRWPGLSLNFGRSPSLVPTWRKRRYGPRLLLSTGLVQVRGAEPDVLVEGFSSAHWPDGWAVALNCSSAAVWDIGVWGPTTSPDSRWDVNGSTSTGTMTTTSTSLALSAATIDSVWSTDPTSLPYTVVAAGEAMTVTAMTAYAGTGPYTQTATVTRSVNNVVKTHAANEPVSLFLPARYGV